MEPTHILATRINNTCKETLPTAHDIDAFYDSHGFEWYAALTGMFGRLNRLRQQRLTRGETMRNFAPEPR